MTASTQRSGVKRLRHGCGCMSVFTGSTRLEFNYSSIIALPIIILISAALMVPKAPAGLFSGSQEVNTEAPERFKKVQQQ